MTAEEFYKKNFGNADSIPKDSVLILLRHFAKALKLEREKASRVHDVIGRSEQLAAFLKWYYENDECPDLVTYEAAAERYLKNYSTPAEII